MLEPVAERLARLGLGLGAFVALAVFLWPVDFHTLDPVLGGAFLTAFVLWLVAEIRSLKRRPPHPHDSQFIQELRSLITLDAVRYLQQQDFGSTYRNDLLDGFWRVDFEAQAVGYGPHDPILRRKFTAFKQKLNEFRWLLATHGGPIGGHRSLATIIPDRERAADHFTAETWKLVTQVNKMADDVVNLFDELMRTARNRVPDAFVGKPRARNENSVPG